MNDNRLLPRGDSSQRPAIPDFNGNGQPNQNWMNQQNLNTQRNNNIGNLSRGKNFLVQNSSNQQQMESQKQKTFKNQNNSMLYGNSDGSKGGNVQTQSDLISRRQKMTGSGGLNQSVGSANLNPLSTGSVTGQSQHPSTMNNLHGDMSQN